MKLTGEQKRIATENGIAINTVYSRLDKGWSVKQAINIPVDAHRLVTNEQIEIAKKNGIEYGTLYSRVATYGWNVEDAITVPVDTIKGNKGAHWSKIPKDIKERARTNGISLTALHKRLYVYKWSIERAVTQPPQGRTPFLTDEQKIQALKNNLNRATIYTRIKKLKWTVEEAVNTPAGEKRGERRA